MGVLSDLFLRILYGGPLRSRSVSSLTVWGPPQTSFFAYYMGPPPRSVSLHTIWGPPSDQFLRLIWGPPQVSFFAYYVVAPQSSFFAYHMGTPSDQFLRLVHRGSLRLIFSSTVWGPLSDQFLRVLCGG